MGLKVSAYSSVIVVHLTLWTMNHWSAALQKITPQIVRITPQEKVKNCSAILSVVKTLTFSATVSAFHKATL